MKVKIKIILEIDSEDLEKIDYIIQEMDYNFSYVEMEEDKYNKAILHEYQYIKRTQIEDYILL